MTQKIIAGEFLMRKFFLTGLIIFIFAIKNFALAAEIPPAPTENIYVADFAEMIDADTKNKILEIGGELDSKYKAQIMVITVPNLGNYQLEEYADEFFKSWNIGDKDLNNGVLLFIAKDERRFQIEVGKGLEGAISAESAGKILEDMTNYFRDGNFSEGILTAYGTLTKKVYEQYRGAIPENIPAPKIAKEETLSDMIISLLAVAAFFVAFYFLLKYIFVLPIAASIYIVSALAYFVTHGKHGTLDFKSIYVSLTEFVDIGRFNFFSSSESKDEPKGGKTSKRKGGKKRG